MESNGLNETPEQGDTSLSKDVEKDASDETGLSNGPEFSIYVLDRRSRPPSIADTINTRTVVIVWKHILQFLSDILLGSLLGVFMAVFGNSILWRLEHGHDWLLLLLLPGYFLVARHVATKRKVLGYALGIVSILFTLFCIVLSCFFSALAGPDYT